MKRVIKDTLITAGILIAAFLISIAFQNVFRVDEHISTLFAFAVFLISMLTQGYVYGIVSAFIGTLAINYAFTFPYFAFNFTIPVNLISALVMVTIALLTGALTTKVKYHEAIKAESEKERMRANLLRAVSHDIRTPLTPVIVLSARTGEQDKVYALDLGANDYVTKPFGSAELLARVRAALRSNRHSADEGKFPGGRFVLGALSIDYDARRVFLNETEIKLTQTEYNILACLSEHHGKMMTYSTIIKTIWGDTADDGSIKKLQVNMANIRKKFGIKPGDATYIKNELGVGYRMDL